EHQPNPSPRPSPSTTTPAFIPDTSGENFGGHSSSEVPIEHQPNPSPRPSPSTTTPAFIPDTSGENFGGHSSSEVPIEHQPNPSPRPSPSTTTPAFIPDTSGENLGGHSSSDKFLSGNEGDMTIQGVYDLCLSLCKQVSDQAKEIQDLKAKITKLKKQAKPVIKHHKAYLKSVSLKQRFPRKSFSKKHRVHKESVSKQGRKFAKGESSVQRDPLFDEMPEDTIDHMETENAQSEGRTREMVNEDKEIDERILSIKDVLSTDKEGVSTDFEKVSTDRPIVSTDGSKVSTDRQIEGTEEQVEGRRSRFSHPKGFQQILSCLNYKYGDNWIRRKNKGSTLKQSTAKPAHIPKGYTQAISSKVPTAPNCVVLTSDEIICSFLLLNKHLCPQLHDDEKTCCKLRKMHGKKLTFEWQEAMINSKDKKFMRKNRKSLDLKNQRMALLLIRSKIEML
ncbi:hypothetical protein Tco_1153638, partial [Tanacetum coccineum]